MMAHLVVRVAQGEPGEQGRPFHQTLLMHREWGPKTGEKRGPDEDNPESSGLEEPLDRESVPQPSASQELARFSSFGRQWDKHFDDLLRSEGFTTMPSP